jgi:hypothetical protein
LSKRLADQIQYEVVASEAIEKDSVIGEVMGRVEYQSARLNNTVDVFLPTDNNEETDQLTDVIQKEANSAREEEEEEEEEDDDDDDNDEGEDDSCSTDVELAIRKLKAAQELEERFGNSRLVIDTTNAGNELRFTNSSSGVPHIRPNASMVTVVTGGQVRTFSIKFFAKLN